MTKHQTLGDRGEDAVCKLVSCPQCGREKHLRKLPKNFQCADVICRFCGFLAQVKSTTLDAGTSDRPSRLLGAAWGPQNEQIVAGIFHGLFVAGFAEGKKLVFIDYVPGHVLQSNLEVFRPRNPLKKTARRAGWQGFYYELSKLPEAGVCRVIP